jgi:RNA polymerase sigma-70 factor, ECF subfamily
MIKSNALVSENAKMVLDGLESDLLGNKELYRTYYRMGRKRTGNDDDAHELVSILYLKAIRGAEGYDGHHKLKTWLGAIYNNLFRDYLRRKKDKKEIQLDEDLVDSWKEKYEEPCKELMGKETQRILERALDRIPPDQKRAFIMSEGMSIGYKDIAKGNYSEVTARKRVDDAKRSLKSDIELMELVEV